MTSAMMRSDLQDKVQQRVTTPAAIINTRAISVCMTKAGDSHRGHGHPVARNTPSRVLQWLALWGSQPL